MSEKTYPKDFEDIWELHKSDWESHNHDKVKLACFSFWIDGRILGYSRGHQSGYHEGYNSGFRTANGIEE